MGDDAFMPTIVGLDCGRLRQQQRTLIGGGSRDVIEIPAPAWLVRHPAGDVVFDMDARQFGADLRDHFVDVAFAIDALRRQPAGDALVVVGLQVAEAQVFQFPLDLPDAETIRQRRVNVARFAGDPFSLGLRRVLAVANQDELRGELDQHQPRIGHDGEQHLAQGFGLRSSERGVGLACDSR